MTATDSTLAGILRAILEEPHEDVHRLVYADWLEENGKGYWDEHIRDRIRRELADPNASFELADPHRLGVESGVFRRGFVESVSLSLAAFQAHSKTIFYSHPVVHVKLSDRAPGGNPPYALWARGDEDVDVCRHALPETLFILLDGHDEDEVSMHPALRVYRSRDTADAALSRACVALGRSRAGLPPLP